MLNYAKWPGYSNSGTYIPVQSNGGYINRGRLATLICLHIARFMNRASVSLSCSRCPTDHRHQLLIFITPRNDGLARLGSGQSVGGGSR